MSGLESEKNPASRAGLFFWQLLQSSTLFNAGVGGTFLHGAPHAAVRLRFEGVGTRVGPRLSGGDGEANLTMPRLFEGRWSGIRKIDLRVADLLSVSYWTL